MDLSESIESLRVGPFDVEVNFIEGDDAEYMDDHGTFCRQMLLIRINGKLSWQNRLETLMHEAVHAIIYASGLRLDDDKEEELVSRMTPFFVSFLRDNPHFIDAIDYYSGNWNTDGERPGDR